LTGKGGAGGRLYVKGPLTSYTRTQEPEGCQKRQKTEAHNFHHRGLQGKVGEKRGRGGEKKKLRKLHQEEEQVGGTKKTATRPFIGSLEGVSLKGRSFYTKGKKRTNF